MGRPRKLPPGMTKRGDVYYAKFRKDNRLIQKRLSPNYKAACEMLNDLRARVDKAGIGIIDNDYPWSDLKAEFLRWARQETTMADDYKRTLGYFEAYRPVTSIRHINHDFVFGFREWRAAQKKTKNSKENVSVRTVNRNVSTLQSMLNKGVKWGRIGYNPIAGLSPLENLEEKKVRRSLSPEEVTSILENSPQRLREVFLTFLTTGLRLNELVSLTFSDIDFQNHTATVQKKNSKTGKEREVPLCDEVMAIIQRKHEEAPFRHPVEGKWLEQTKQQYANFSKDHVFVTLANTPMRNNLLTRFYAICKKAGIADAVPGGAVDIHGMRVSFATLALESGGTPKAVQEILGHSTLDMTMKVYNRARSESKRAAVGALPFATVTEPSRRDIISISEAG